MKHIFLHVLIISAALLLLTACNGTSGYERSAGAPDMFPQQIDPQDAQLVSSIQQFLAEAKGPKNSQYEYVRADLNGDGLREGLVMFKLPHSYWCGWSGCTMAVFQAGDDNFTLLSQTSRIRGPIVVGETRTNGWEDIGVRLSGMQEADRNVLLKFDGIGYPRTPTDQEEIPYDLASLGGSRFFP